MSGAWFYRPDWSVLRVAGPDAASFLHNMCTNDIKKLEAGAACEALFTDVKGKVRAHAIVCRFPDSGFGVIVTSPAAGDLATHLERYHIREDLQIENAAGGHAVVVSDAGLAIPKVIGFPLPALTPNAAVACLPEPLSDPIVVEGFQELDGSAFDRLRIRSRFPLDCVDVDASNLPQELNRDEQLVSFTKGCYLGQETVARIDALGRVNQLLVRLGLTGCDAAEAGDELFAGDKKVGRLTTVAADQALGYVRREHASPGVELRLEHGAARVL